MSTFDSNAWYQVTDSRVGFNSSLQVTGVELFIAASGGYQYWQLFPLDDGNFQIRNRLFGVREQLATCYNALETDPTRTRPCLLPAVGDDAQKWSVNPWGDGTYYLVNLANGSGYHLDWHMPFSLFMSSTVPIADEREQPAQHWQFSSIAAVNDGMYSSAVVPIASSTAASIPTSATATTSSASSRLSVGAAAGLGVGVALAVFLGVSLLLFLIRRRRRRRRRNRALRAQPTTRNMALENDEWHKLVPELPPLSVQEMAVPPAEMAEPKSRPHELGAMPVREEGKGMGYV